MYGGFAFKLVLVVYQLISGSFHNYPFNSLIPSVNFC